MNIYSKATLCVIHFAYICHLNKPWKAFCEDTLNIQYFLKHENSWIIKFLSAQRNLEIRRFLDVFKSREIRAIEMWNISKDAVMFNIHIAFSSQTYRKNSFDILLFTTLLTFELFSSKFVAFIDSFLYLISSQKMHYAIFLHKLQALVLISVKIWHLFFLPTAPCIILDISRLKNI